MKTEKVEEKKEEVVNTKDTQDAPEKGITSQASGADVKESKDSNKAVKGEAK